VAFTANDYIVDAAELYGDTAYDRISTATWIKYLNAAVRALILVRPDAGAVTESVQLVAGIKQTLPTAALRLLDISRNMGTDGATAGKIITPSDRSHIDYSNLLWPAATGQTYIDNFAYDSNVPRTYYVTPPVHSVTAVYVEMTTSQLPTTMTTTGSDDGIEDIFFEPIIQFILWKAYSADDEGLEFAKAKDYFNTFLQLLGIEQQTSQIAGPEGRE
jgi:hypothetical protein